LKRLIYYYVRLCGFPPFYDDNNQQLFALISKGEFDFPSPYWDDISNSAKNLIKQLLVVDAKERLDCDKIMSHPWMVGHGTPSVELPEVFQKKLKEFNARRKLQKAGRMIIAANRFKNILKVK
jgi:calcium/calmodulin-dependent protein kinase I